MFALLSVLTLWGSDKGYFIRGVVRDAVTDETVPNAFVTVDSGTRGTMTDARGIFELTVPDNTQSITVRCQGYEDQRLEIRKNRVNLYAVYLNPAQVQLDEVVVKRRKYSKKNNPAVELMRHIRRTAHANDPTQKPHYSYDKYRRTTIALNNFMDDVSANGMLSKMPFLAEHIDTSEVSGKPILPVSVREESSKVYWRNDPRGHHEIITGTQNEGIDNFMDAESMRRFVNDVLGEIDIYARDVTILQNRFVSPLSPIGADFYKYYITDSVESGGRKFYTLSFYPHNKTAFGFTGQMSVTRTDSTAFVREVTMKVPSEINLNFIDNMYVHQQFEEAPDGSRLKVRDDLTLEIQIVPGTKGLYARRTLATADHSFDAPADEKEIFKPKAPVTMQAGAMDRDSVFWDGARLFEPTRNETRVALLMTRLRQNKVYYWGEKAVKWMVTGYVPTSGKRSLIDVGPLNTTVSANELEGLRLRGGFITTAMLNRHLFSRVYTAYGFKDHRWKYGLELEYSFNAKQRHSREFPVHSFRLNSTYDVDRPGQDYIFTNPDNVFLSLHRPGTDPMTYHRLNTLLYTHELETNFSVKALIGNERQYSTRLMPFDTPSGTTLRHFDETWCSVELRYAPGEKFYQTTSNRFPITLDAPVVTLSHRWAPGGLGSYGNVHVTSASFMKRFWLSAFGYLDVLVKGGHVWSRGTPFNHLFIANTNLSYTIQPESFALTAPMEFVADSYGMWDLTYWANGSILNHIPLVKKLKLREVFALRGFYGHLSDRNDPACNPGMIVWPGWETTSVRLKTPYLEAALGLDNIFKCLRVDYVWRLNHDRQGEMVAGSSRHGFRVAFHVTF